MKSYIAMLQQTKPEYLKHNAHWWNLGTPNYGQLGDEHTFNRWHSAATQAIAKYVAQGHSLNWTPGLTSYCAALVGVKGDTNALGDHTAYGLTPNEWKIIELAFEAIVTIAIVLLFPPLGIIAGFVAEAAWIICKFLVALIIANLAIDVLSGAYGVGGQDYSSQLTSWAQEAPAV
jgi:hypothetical protein